MIACLCSLQIENVSDLFGISKTYFEWYGHVTNLNIPVLISVVVIKCSISPGIERMLQFRQLPKSRRVRCSIFELHLVLFYHEHILPCCCLSIGMLRHMKPAVIRFMFMIASVRILLSWRTWPVRVGGYQVAWPGVDSWARDVIGLAP